MPRPLSPAYHDSPLIWKDLLLRGLAEDQWQWDFTTLGTLQNPEKSISAQVIAKEAGIWAVTGLLGACERISEEMGFPLTVRSNVENGENIRAGQTVATLKGPARAALALERPFLNLAAYACGIASATRRMVDLVKKACPRNPPKITSTRKTLPLYRDIAVHGVLCGGGQSHRLSLGGGILIKENHVAAAGGIKNAVASVRGVSPHGLKIEIEVRDIRELRTALGAGVDGVLLDNFSPEAVHEALAELGKSPHRIFVEASGGIREENVASYALPGIDVISVGALTHSARVLDLSMLLGR